MFSYIRSFLVSLNFFLLVFGASGGQLFVPDTPMPSAYWYFRVVPHVSLHCRLLRLRGIPIFVRSIRFGLEGSFLKCSYCCSSSFIYSDQLGPDTFRFFSIIKFNFAWKFGKDLSSLNFLKRIEQNLRFIEEGIYFVKRILFPSDQGIERNRKLV